MVIEILAKERRTMFLAMTRATRVLLVLAPIDNDGSLYEGFNSTRWNAT